MRGDKARVISLIPYKAELKDEPQNKYVFDASINSPWLGIPIQRTYEEVVLSRRNIPMMVMVRHQPVQTRIQDENFQLTLSGGLAILPNHEGSLWNRL